MGTNETASVVAAQLPYPQWLQLVAWSLTILCCFETTLGNLLVLLAYKLERNIRKHLSNKFIVSLAISDMIIGIEGFPLLTMYILENEQWPLGSLACKFWLLLDYTLCLVSIFTVLLITVDRYFSVRHPAVYHNWQTPHKVHAAIATSWLLPCAFFTAMIFGWDLSSTNHQSSELLNAARGKCYAPFLDNPYVNTAMYIGYYWSTLVVISILYNGIHRTSRRLQRKQYDRQNRLAVLAAGQHCAAQLGISMAQAVKIQAPGTTTSSGESSSDQPAVGYYDGALKVEYAQQGMKRTTSDKTCTNGTDKGVHWKRRGIVRFNSIQLIPSIEQMAENSDSQLNSETTPLKKETMVSQACDKNSKPIIKMLNLPVNYGSTKVPRLTQSVAPSEIAESASVNGARKHARRAFRTITIIVGAFALFWSPYFIVATVYGICPQCVSNALYFFTYYLCYLNSSINPFAYAFVNRMFRETFIQILKGHPRMFAASGRRAYRAA